METQFTTNKFLSFAAVCFLCGGMLCAIYGFGWLTWGCIRMWHVTYGYLPPVKIRVFIIVLVAVWTLWVLMFFVFFGVYFWGFRDVWRRKDYVLTVSDGGVVVSGKGLYYELLIVDVQMILYTNKSIMFVFKQDGEGKVLILPCVFKEMKLLKKALSEFPQFCDDVKVMARIIAEYKLGHRYLFRKNRPTNVIRL